MKKYIIRYKMKINGEWSTVYHMDITENDNNETMNVYVEHLTTHKREAKRFYKFGEAVLIAALFENLHQIGKVIQVSNKQKKHHETSV